MTHARIGLVLVVLFALMGCDRRPKPETLVEGGYDQAEMEAATQRARNEVDAFIAELQAGTAESFAVKAPISENDQVEHFWLTDVSFDGERFTGTINNDPGIVTHVKLGQPWSLGKTEISDWLYMRDGKMYGITQCDRCWPPCRKSRQSSFAAYSRRPDAAPSQPDA